MAALALFSRRTLFSVFLTCALAGCGHRVHQELPDHSDALIVCPGAVGTNWTRWEGTDQLSYRVETDYPAVSIVSCISEQLKDKGWQALDDDYWNPGLPSSHKRGWLHFVDSTVQPEATVDQWAGQWKDQSGDIAWYFLQYRYPPGDRHVLAVNAGFIPANAAKKMPKNPRLTE